MKKQLLFLLGILAFTVSMAQTNKAVDDKDGATNTTVLPDYNGICNCGNPMSYEEFNKLLSDIKVKGTDSKMLSFAKVEIRDKCLLASQVEEITLVFMFDTSRSNFVRFAKKYTYDQDNYYALRLKYPKGKDNYQNQKSKTNSSQEILNNELHNNWERTNKANVVYVNWLQSSYGSGPYDQINR